MGSPLSWDKTKDMISNILHLSIKKEQGCFYILISDILLYMFQKVFPQTLRDILMCILLFVHLPEYVRRKPFEFLTVMPFDFRAVDCDQKCLL